MNKQNFKDKHIDDYITALKQQDISDDEALNINKRIKIAVANEASQLSRQSSSQAKNSFTRFLTAFKSRLLYAGTSALAVAMLSLVVFVGGNTPSAFAQVQQHLTSVTSMFYQSNMLVQQQPIMTLSVWYQEPGLIRVETTPLTPQAKQSMSINVIDSINGKGLMLFPGPKVSVPYEFQPNATLAAKDNPLHWFQVAKDYQGEITQLKARLVNNQWLNGFKFTEAGYSVVLWSTQDNNLPVEFAIYNGETAETSDFLMQGNLSFNQPLNPTLFSQDVPANYHQKPAGDS
ncbi:LolA family protein [Aliikangiella sp. IMCC44632]